MKCENCGYDWTGHEAVEGMGDIATCPECPDEALIKSYLEVENDDGEISKAD